MDGHKDIEERLASVRLVLFDFDGVFTDNTVVVDQNGKESVRCWRSDGLGLKRLRESGVEMAIVSTEANPVVSIRARKLGVDVVQGVDDKAEVVRAFSERLGIGLDAVAFVGNDINDIPALTIVGTPVVVQDAYREVEQHALWKTECPGGRGAVREVCDRIVQAKAR